MKINKVLTVFSVGAALAIVSPIDVAQAASAPYTLSPPVGDPSYSVVYQEYGVLNMGGGDTFKVLKAGPFPQLKDATVQIAVQQADVGDGQGPWPIIQGDQIGQDADNGYLLIPTNVISPWVKRDGGNLSFVTKKMAEDGGVIELQDLQTYQTYNYYSFSLATNESGSVFGTPTPAPVS